MLSVRIEIHTLTRLNVLCMLRTKRPVQCTIVFTQHTLTCVRISHSLGAIEKMEIENIEYLEFVKRIQIIFSFLILIQSRVELVRHEHAYVCRAHRSFETRSYQPHSLKYAILEKSCVSLEYFSKTLRSFLTKKTAHAVKLARRCLSATGSFL